MVVPFTVYVASPFSSLSTASVNAFIIAALGNLIEYTDSDGKNFNLNNNIIKESD